MLRYHYAFLRARRRFDKDWGTSITARPIPRVSPLAVRLAYDMGARYLWYWTSDHGHHLPWPEQMELTKLIREHARAHAAASIRRPRPTLDTLILIPYGIFLTLESPTRRKQPFDLRWVREMDAEGKNDSSQRFLIASCATHTSRSARPSTRLTSLQHPISMTASPPRLFGTSFA